LEILNLLSILPGWLGSWIPILHTFSLSELAKISPPALMQ
jgi:hypothetical protein